MWDVFSQNIHRYFEMITELLIAVNKFCAGFDIFRDLTKHHPIHSFMVEIWFHYNKLLQLVQNLERQAREELTETTKHIIILGFFIKED